MSSLNDFCFESSRHVFEDEFNIYVLEDKLHVYTYYTVTRIHVFEDEFNIPSSSWKENGGTKPNDPENASRNMRRRVSGDYSNCREILKPFPLANEYLTPKKNDYEEIINRKTIANGFY